MSITKGPGHMRSLKLNSSATVLTLGLKAKIFENLRLCQAKFWGELRTRATFDRCVEGGRVSKRFLSRFIEYLVKLLLGELRKKVVFMAAKVDVSIEYW